MTTPNSGGPNTSWLDEELRRERELLETLRDVVEKQQVTIIDQTQRIISLEDRLTKLHNELLRLPESEERLQRLRDGIVVMIAELRQDLQKRHTEFLRNRQAEREQDSKIIQEIRLELDRIAPLEQAVAVSKAEQQRLNEQLSRLQQSLEDLARSLERSEEARRMLADRIAKNNVTASQAVERIDAQLPVLNELRSRLLVVEDRLAKMEQRASDLENMRQEITEQQTEFTERLRRVDRTRAQTLAEWGRRLDSFTQQIDAWGDQLRFFSDQHEKNRQILRDIQSLAQEVAQQQDRLRQQQRVAEEQLRREMRELRAETDYRWAQELERRKLSAQAQDRRDTEQDTRLAALEEGMEKATAQLEEATSTIRALREALDHDRALQREEHIRMWDTISRALQQAIQEIIAPLQQEK